MYMLISFLICRIFKIFGYILTELTFFNVERVCNQLSISCYFIHFLSMKVDCV